MIENVWRSFREVRAQPMVLMALLALALVTGCNAAPGLVSVSPSVEPRPLPTSPSIVLESTATAMARPSATSAPVVTVAPSPTQVPATRTPVPAPTLAPTRSPTPAPAPAANLKTYTSPAYNVTLQYPANWSKDPRYDTLNQERYVGTDGFFQVSAASAASLDEAAKNEANHILHPYGTHPTIAVLKVAGQDARLILPSSDQPAEMAGQAALIVQSPKRIKLGTDSYPYLVLWADQTHIKSMGLTLSYIVLH